MKANEIMSLYRKEHYGINQIDMAKKMHVSESTYKKMEQGRVELKFDTVMNFIGILSKCPVIKGKKPISIFNFFYQIDNDFPKYNKITEQILENVCSYPKYYEPALTDYFFNENEKPINRRLFLYKPFKDFLYVMKEEIDKYYPLLKDYNDMKNSLYQAHKDKTIVDKKLNSLEFKNEYLYPLKSQREHIETLLLDFLDGFLKFYCNIDN